MKALIHLVVFSAFGIIFSLAAKAPFPVLASAKVHTMAVGQGDAHIIECKMSRAGKAEYEYEFAIVDMGSSSIKDRDTVDRMNRLVKNGKVSAIFLTHPDEDHYNYLPHFVKYFNYKIQNIYLGGSKELWNSPSSKSKEFIDELSESNIFSGPNSLSYKTVSMFANGNKKLLKRQKVSLCEGHMDMEIIYGGHDSNDKDTNEKSLVMRLTANNRPNSKSMLFMGDIEGSSVIKALLSPKRNAKLRSDVWVLPHHGAAPQTIEGMQQYMNLAQTVMAEKIIISSDIKGSYGHPRCDTIRNVAPTMNGNVMAFNRILPQSIENTCQTSLSNIDIGINHEDIIQCWSGSEESRLYESYFCNTASLGVTMRQTTKQDMNGNSIWNDITTDIV